jgi:hypothetical protein
LISAATMPVPPARHRAGWAHAAGLACKLLAFGQTLPGVGTRRDERGLIEGGSRQPEQMRVVRGRPVGEIGQDLAYRRAKLVAVAGKTGRNDDVRVLR